MELTLLLKADSLLFVLTFSLYKMYAAALSRRIKRLAIRLIKRIILRLRFVIPFVSSS